MQRLRSIYFQSGQVLGNERGIILAISLIIVVLLVGMGLSTTYSGFTNLTLAVNSRHVTRAASTAKAGVNEALYRLSRQIGQPGAITIDTDDAFWNDPNMEIEIQFTSGDTDSSDGTLSTLQDSGDWPSGLDPVVLRYKNPTGTAGDVLFYDRTLNPPFRTISLPAAAGAIPDSAKPVVEILASGLDDRGAERHVAALAANSSLFPPPAALSSGVNVDMGGSGFIDSANHSPFIQFSDALGNDAMYGDQGGHTTQSFVPALRASPDDSGINPDAANQYLPDVYAVDAREYNMQINAGADPAITTDAAFVGLRWNTGTLQWNGVNTNPVSPIALGNGAVLLNVPTIGNNPLSKGLFTWGANSAGAVPGTDYDPNPPLPTACTGATPPLVCRPGDLATFPTFQEFLGLDDVAFQKLLDNADTTEADLASGPPLGFTYINGNYNFNNSSDMPPDGEYGLMYVTGNLRFNGGGRFKGIIWIDGDLDTTGNNYFLGAIMVRGITETDAFGNFKLMYSKDAAEWGLQAGNPWRVIGWADTELQN